MGKRRKHSKIDQLEPAVKETVDEMIKTGAYYREIVDYIQSHGVSISLAAVGKYAKNLMSTLDALRLSQENFRAIMEETDRYPDLDMTDGILRLLCNQMLDAINKLPEERLQEVDFDTLSKNAVALTRAVAYKKNVDVKTRDALENGAEQFRDLIFEAMAAERPDLYQEVRRKSRRRTRHEYVCDSGKTWNGLRSSSQPAKTRILYPLSAANPVHPERRYLDRPDRTDFFRIFVFRISRAFAVRVLL